MNRRLLSLFVLLVPIVAAAQVRLSVDEKCVQVAQGKKRTTERTIYLHADGRMVMEQHTPAHTIALSNSLGEVRLYHPQTGEVVVMNDKEMASTREMVAVFASGAYTDMALPLYGYTQSEIRRDGRVMVKTFEPKNAGPVAKVEVAFENHLPICMIYFNGKGEEVRKLYFSRYEYGRTPMPMRITEVEYTTKRDSLVRLTTYSNLLFDEAADSAMFDWQVPTDAKRIEVDPKQLLQQK